MSKSIYLLDWVDSEASFSSVPDFITRAVVIADSEDEARTLMRGYTQDEGIYALDKDWRNFSRNDQERLWHELFGSRRENAFWVDPSLSKCVKIGDYVGDDKSRVLMYDS